MLPLLIANVKMMLRDRQTLFWALVFPLIFVVVFGLFDVGGAPSANIAVIDQAHSDLSQSIRTRLASIESLKIKGEYADEERARKALDDRDLQYMLVIPPELGQLSPSPRATEPVTLTLYYRQTEIQTNQLLLGVIQQVFDDLNLRLASAPSQLVVTQRPVEARRIKYFDVLLVGLVGMAVMFNSIIVIAVKVSGYRSQRIFQRILVTPLPVRNYFVAEVLAHLALAVVQAAIILAVGVLLFGGHIYGNLLWLLIILVFADIVFLNIGFIISAWANSPAAASGLGNVVALPMMFFSGTFFPTSSLPAFLPDLVKVLPLTPTLEALRKVALDDQALWQTWPQLAMLAGWVAVSSLAAVKLFRFR